MPRFFFLMAIRVVLASVIALGISTPACLLGSGIAGAHTLKKDAIVFDRSHNGQTVIVKMGTDIEIRLQGNPTTGYTWQVVTIGGTSVVLKGEMEYHPDPHILPVVGSGGTFSLRLKAKQLGKSTVKLEYVRPWEKGKPPVEEFSVTVQVQ